jgi:hypothetical protein
MAPRLRRRASLWVLAGMASLFAVFGQTGDLPAAGSAPLACPFVDGDGGAPGIQVTQSVTVDDVDDGGGNVGDFYDCTASLVEIEAGVIVTLGSNTSTLAIAEIHFSDVVIEPGATVSADGQGHVGVNGFSSIGNGPGGGAQAAGGGYGGVGGGQGGGPS